MTVSLPVEIWLKNNTRVDENTGCWLWVRRLDKDGYAQGRRAPSRSPIRVHRVSYEHFKGPIPEGLQIDHLCRTRNCVNPDHLEPVTCRENIVRSPRVQKTHCLNGHPLSGENLVIVIFKEKKMRGCKVCRLRRTKEYRQRLKISEV